jgi:hypothetical protein
MMKHRVGTVGIWAALLLTSLSVQSAFAQAKIEADAAKVLGEMSDYLGSLQRFSVDYDVETEVVSYDGQKLQFISSGAMEVQRPDKLHASRKGAVVDFELMLDGKVLSLFGKNMNAFYQVPAATIDEAINVLRNDVGFDAPGADLLAKNLCSRPKRTRQAARMSAWPSSTVSRFIISLSGARRSIGSFG